MFVRIRKLPGKKEPLHYAYLVSNQWNAVRRKHEQKILMSLGRVSDLPIDGTIEKVITALDSFATKMGFSSLSNGVVLSDLRDETSLTKTYEYGTVLLTRHLMKHLSFPAIFQRAWEKSKQCIASATNAKGTRGDGEEHQMKRNGEEENPRKKKALVIPSLEKFLTACEALLSYRLYPRTAASDLGTYHWYTQEVFFGSKRKHREKGESDENNSSLQKKESTPGESSPGVKAETADTNTSLDALPLNKDDLYRSLDILLENKDAIEEGYSEQNKDLFTEGLDLVLFDTTSIFYYGAETPTSETALLQYGYSKDGKGNEKQVIVGVLMTKSGVPVAHEVFSGNTADTKAFAKIISIIKQKYRLKQVILIADRGMISEENLLHLEQMEYSYLIGVRMRKLQGVLQKKLLEPLDPEDITADMEQVYQPYRLGRKPKQTIYTKTGTLRNFSDENLEKLFIKNILKKKISTFDKSKLLKILRKRRYFVCYNPLVAYDTKEKRKYFKDILKKKISNTPTKDWIIKNGYKKYLTFPDGINPTLDEQQLSDEELFDGKWVLISNDQHLTSSQAILYYKTLQTIERGFWDLKSLITIRPIYHWKEERIKAHIFVCFLSLIMKWYICRLLDKDSQEQGRQFIHEMINLKAIEIDETIPLYVRTAISLHVQDQMKKLGMDIPKKILLDARTKPNTLNPKGGRPRKVDPQQYRLTFLEEDTDNGKQATKIPEKS